MPHTGSMTSASVAVSGGVEVVDIEVSGPAGAGPTRDPTLLHVLLRVGVELRLAALRAEVVGLALVLAGAGGLGRIHLHAAHGVLHRCLLFLRARISARRAESSRGPGIRTPRAYAPAARRCWQTRPGRVARAGRRPIAARCRRARSRPCRAADRCGPPPDRGPDQAPPRRRSPPTMCAPTSYTPSPRAATLRP